MLNFIRSVKKMLPLGNGENCATELKLVQFICSFCVFPSNKETRLFGPSPLCSCNPERVGIGTFKCQIFCSQILVYEADVKHLTQ